MELNELFEGDASEQAEVAQIDTASLSKYVQLALEVDDAITRCEEQLAVLSKRRQTLLTRLLPETMDGLKLSKITGQDGSVLSIGTKVFGSLPKEDPEARSRAIGWLKANGHEGVVKYLFTADLGKGAGNQAAEFAELLKIRVPSAIIDFGETVHTQTLQALLKKEVEKGTSVPLDDFNASVVRLVKIKRPSGIEG